MHEFNLIERYFKSQHKQRADVILGIGDDCALLRPPVDQLLVVSTDTMVENIHFLPNTNPHALGHKSLAVSLSDLAAMGAEPAWVMLSVSLPLVDEQWIADFCVGFFRLLDDYQLQLVGGNTSAGPLSITTHVTGFVAPGKALQRNGAKPGDDIYVTGHLGDAALGLRCLKKQSALPHRLQMEVIYRLEYPTPRIAVGLALRNIASACIDISDGLAADLGHILKQSQVGAVIIAENLPLSFTLLTLPSTTAWELALSGGDDYELCFTAAPDKRLAISNLCERLCCNCQRIGVIEGAPGLEIKDAGGQVFNLQHRGYEHF